MARSFKTPESRSEFKLRVEKLVSKIKAYDSSFDPKLFLDAMNWGSARPRITRNTPWNDRFARPLDIVETLVDLEQANPDTLIAAALYTAVIPQGINGLDREGLSRIRQHFGPQIYGIVEDTLSLWSLHHLRQTSESKQSSNENIRDYKLMALLVARSRDAVVIRAAESYRNLREFDPIASREERDAVFEQAKIMADLAYLARFPDVRRAILNEHFRISDPRRFAEYQQHSHTAPRLNEGGDGIRRESDHPGQKKDLKARVEEEDINAIKQMVANALGDAKVTADDFELEFRPKDAFSIADKTGRKGQNVDQLGDVWGGRIIVKEKFLQEQFLQKKTNKSGKPRHLRQEPGQNVAEMLHWRLSRMFGRNCEQLKPFYEDLVLRDPKSTDPTKDDRYDNYYRDVKPSGYRAVQDTFFFRVNGKVIEVEMQFVDEKTHENNTNGKPSHRLMKTDQFKNVDIIQAWEQYSTQLLEVGGRRPQAPWAAVYLPNNDIVKVKGGEQGVTADDFIRQHIGAIRELYPDVRSVRDIEGVHIDNSNPLMGRNPVMPVLPIVNLRSGDRITGFVTKGGLADGPA